jgi:capsular polysaccharide biosynthesis protein
VALKKSFGDPSDSKTPFLPIAIFDLQQLKIPTIGSQIELRSFAFGETKDPLNPSFATIALENNIGYHYTGEFLDHMQATLRQLGNKPTVVIDEPALLLPYCTTHFGHFTGDCLGAIITLSKLAQKQQRKLFYIAPNHFDAVIKKHGNGSRLEKINSQQAYLHNLIFSDACLLPRISPWQNLSLCSQIFGEVQSQTQISARKVFLTSERADRIENIDAVIAFLKSKNVYILNPLRHGFEGALAILRDAEVVISESGSITHNILIARIRNFYILCSPRCSQLSSAEFAGGGIYNAYKEYLCHYIECKSIQKQSHHPFSDLIKVDLNDLKAIL